MASLVSCFLIENKIARFETNVTLVQNKTKQKTSQTLEGEKTTATEGS